MARIVDEHGRRRILLSSIPLRSRIGDGSMRPLSLNLVGGGPGELRPENPVVHMRIATDARRGFTLGPDAKHLVTIVPLGLRDDADPGADFAGQVLFANARPGADLLLRPSVSGVQTFEQLKSADAPETFSYRLELKDGQTAELADGIVTIKQAGDVIVRSLPPIAVDADRRPVAVAISLDGDTVRLDAPHRERGFRYPIAVDPDWTSSYDYDSRPGLGLQGWHVGGQPEYYDAFINNVHDPVADPERTALGFFIRPKVTGTSQAFPLGVGAQLFFNAPGTTNIRSVTYGNVHRFNDRDRQTLRLGLYGPSFSEADDVFEAEILSEAPVTLPSVPFPEDQDTPAKSAVMWMFTSPCQAGSDLNCPPVIDSTTRTLLKVGSVQLVLTDFDFPTTQAPGTLRDLQDRWTNATGTHTLDAAATDEGSGVRDLSISVQDATGTHPVRSIQSPCRPDHDQTDPPQDNAICPRTLALEQPLSIDAGRLPEGRSTFTVDASDLADNTAADGGTATSFSVYLDRNEPTATVSGELHDSAAAWMRPRRPSTITVTGTDAEGGQGNTSGIAHNRLRAVDTNGAVVVDRDADTCTPTGPIAAPCDPGKSSTFTIDPRTFPEGPIAFTATSSDLAGNISDAITWTIRIDRTPPAARATGDLLALTSQHTNSTTPTSVTLQGRDATSGVRRLQLIASNSDGEKILADRDTCPTDDIDPADASCPHNPAVQVTINPSELPDGPTTFIARAIDRAGIPSVDNQDWDTYVDHTPPDAPDSVTVTQTSNTSVQITWPTVVDQPLGSGNVSYEYLVTAGGQPLGTWRPTDNPYAQAGGLPPGVTITILVRAIDLAQNPSLPAEGTTQLRLRRGYTANEIMVRNGIDKLQRHANTAGVKIAVKASTSVGLQSVLKRLAKFTRRVGGGIIGVIVALLTGKGDLSCEQGPFFRQASKTFDLAGRRLLLASSARSGSNPNRMQAVRDSQAGIAQLRTAARNNANARGDDDECAAPPKAALEVIERVTPALTQAYNHLNELEQDDLDEYFQTNEATSSNPRGFLSRDHARTGLRTCRELRSRGDCMSLPTLLPGSDTPEARDHVRAAIFSQLKPSLLHYAQEESRAEEGWYTKLPESPCKGKTGRELEKDCDEYPYISTREGGPGASLRPINHSDNRRAGARLRVFYSRCGVNQHGRRFLVMPLPSNTPIPTVIACNGRR